jgi:hypothetical protein
MFSTSQETTEMDFSSRFSTPSIDRSNNTNGAESWLNFSKCSDLAGIVDSSMRCRADVEDTTDGDVGELPNLLESQ